MKRPSPIGAVTIITAIMVLCMTVFAVLAYSSGQAELRMARAGAEAVQAYYEADGTAANLVRQAVGGQPIDAAGAEYDGRTLVADIPAGTRQVLHIEAEIIDGRAHIQQWRTVADTEVGTE